MEAFKRHNLYHVALVERWRETLLADGEYEQVFGPLADAAFVDFFTLPRHLLMLCGPTGLKAALWFTPWFDGAEVGVWVGRGWRHNRTVAGVLVASLGATLPFLSTVICYTRQAHVRRLVERLGFTLVGTIPPVGLSMYFVTAATFKLPSGFNENGTVKHQHN